MVDTVVCRTLNIKANPSDEINERLWMRDQILAIRDNLAVGGLRYPQDLNVQISVLKPIGKLRIHVIYHVDDAHNINPILDYMNIP